MTVRIEERFLAPRTRSEMTDRSAAARRDDARVLPPVTIWKSDHLVACSLVEVLRFVQDDDDVCLLLCVTIAPLTFYFLFEKGTIYRCPYGAPIC